LEAAVCGKRAIALSFAFFDRNHDPEIIAGASRASVRVIEGLAKNWSKDVGLYTVNVPLLEGVEKTKVLWTHMLQNQWTSGSCFTEVDVPNDEDRDPQEEEAAIRRAESDVGERPHLNGKSDEGKGEVVEEEKSGHSRFTHKHFKWSPRFKDVYESVEKASPGNDGWAVKEGYIRYVLFSISLVKAFYPGSEYLTDCIIVSLHSKQISCMFQDSKVKLNCREDSWTATSKKHIDHLDAWLKAKFGYTASKRNRLRITEFSPFAPEGFPTSRFL
jgi:broad specificity polyphosphatase/5'/3'-nucleotidase SurE